MTQVDDFSILVCDHKDHSIPGVLRAAWLREIHPGAKIVIVDDCVPDNDSKGWADYTLQILGFRPDAVFTSEDYGDAYAMHLGSRHVMVDRARTRVPISATQIRPDALRHWEYLEPCVRPYFARRVAIVGAESTGKTTLAMDLAAHFSTAWVPEFGRLYAESKLGTPRPNDWTSAEFAFIAAEQNRMEDDRARTCNGILICDTNAFSTNLWHERYMGRLSLEVEALARDRKYDLCILAAADFPFVPDGLRDGVNIRPAMQERFIDELRRRNLEFLTVTGPHPRRLCAAIQACRSLL